MSPKTDVRDTSWAKPTVPQDCIVIMYPSNNDAYKHAIRNIMLRFYTTFSIMNNVNKTTKGQHLAKICGPGKDYS